LGRPHAERVARAADDGAGDPALMVALEVHGRGGAGLDVVLDAPELRFREDGAAGT
jgi:hypothetical protein